MPLKAHENILVFYKKLPKYNPIKTKGHKKIVKKASADKCIKSSNYGKQYRRSDYNSTERFPRSVLKFTSDRRCTHQKEKHPTQKPVALCEYLIKTYSDENDIVLDNCIGSGTTAVACINTNRQYIGFDDKIKYIRMSKERIALAKGEVGLFS
jgi:site-specific DNA-methyltransferase (adenine-specific)